MCTFSSHLDAHPHIEPAQLEPENKTRDPLAEPTNTFPPEYRPRGTQRESHNTRHAQGYMGMALLLSPPQAFVQDPEENSCLALSPTRLYNHKFAASLLTAPPPTPSGAVHSIWQSYFSGRPYRNRERAPPRTTLEGLSPMYGRDASRTQRLHIRWVRSERQRISSFGRRC